MARITHLPSQRTHAVQCVHLSGKIAVRFCFTFPFRPLPSPPYSFTINICLPPTAGTLSDAWLNSTQQCICIVRSYVSQRWKLSESGSIIRFPPLSRYACPNTSPFQHKRRLVPVALHLDHCQKLVLTTRWVVRTATLRCSRHQQRSETGFSLPFHRRSLDGMPARLRSWTGSDRP